MWSYKVVEENKSCNKVIGTFKGSKPPFGSVPRFKSIIEGFNNIVGNIIFKRLYFNMARTWE